MLFRLHPPLAANPRVEDLLKRASLGCVAEYYRPKLRSIQVSPAQKNFVAKSSSNFLFHLWKLDKSVRTKTLKAFPEAAYREIIASLG